LPLYNPYHFTNLSLQEAATVDSLGRKNTRQRALGVLLCGERVQDPQKVPGLTPLVRCAPRARPPSATARVCANLGLGVTPCPVSTGGGTRRVRLVREGGTRRVQIVPGGGGAHRRAPAAHLCAHPGVARPQIRDASWASGTCPLDWDVRAIWRPRAALGDCAGVARSSACEVRAASATRVVVA
jgi:hypothetical protein